MMSDWIKILAEEDYEKSEYVDVFCPNCLSNMPENYDDYPDNWRIVECWDRGGVEARIHDQSWIEEWICPECGTIFSFTNANY